jgi:hypothetical protein
LQGFIELAIYSQNWKENKRNKWNYKTKRTHAKRIGSNGGN